MTVQDILTGKGGGVLTMTENKTVFDAMQMLVEKNIGIIIIVDNDGKISGVLSERDAVRETYRNADGFKNRPVTEVMTKKVIVVEPGDNIEYVESIMTGNHIRHLPVVENNKLIGLISIGDIVKSLLSKSEFENKYLKDYITGGLIG